MTPAPLRAALVLVVAAGCAGSAPARGPSHHPVDSPDAATSCPAERAAAVAARELLLEPASAPPDGRERAARAALAQAACEARAITTAAPPTGPTAAVIAALRQLRAAHDTAKNLYDEAAGAGLVDLTVAARVGEAELGQAMAAVLADMALPTDLTAAEARADFHADQLELVARFAGEAVLAAERALVAATDAPPASVGLGLAAACAVLRRLDPGVAARQPACAVTASP